MIVVLTTDRKVRGLSMVRRTCFSSLTWLTIALMVTFLLSSCGMSSSGGDTSSTGSSSGSATSPAAHPLLPVRTAQVSLGGSQALILTDARGFALYFYTPDTPTVSACTGGCAITWPPLLTHDLHTALNASPLPGALTVRRTANGQQVEYNGHFLYTYISDSGPDQITGNGVDNWYVATPDLKPPVK
jgi:predicted lipoprotein with Yx(FWY)xxD motif